MWTFRRRHIASMGPSRWRLIRRVHAPAGRVHTLTGGLSHLGDLTTILKFKKNQKKRL